MVIRAVTLVALTLVLVCVLYLPSVYPPERFLAQLSAEHDQARSFWGEEGAVRILARTLAMQQRWRQSEPAGRRSAGQGAHAMPVVSSELSQVHERLFHSEYFRAIDALFVLATYRFAALLEWLPWLSLFVAAAAVDGLVRRVVKSKEFLHHDPELFALHASLAIVVACATIVALVLPWAVHPLALGFAPIAVATCGRFAIANYHRRA